jgi:hypothetical protein
MGVTLTFSSAEDTPTSMLPVSSVSLKILTAGVTVSLKTSSIVFGDLLITSSGRGEDDLSEA